MQRQASQKMEATDPVCPAFDDELADVLLRSARISDSDPSTISQEPTLFRVESKFLARLSPVFRDMFTVCDSQSDTETAAQPYIQLEEGCSELCEILQANSDDIREHPDFSTYSSARLLKLLMLAVKYSMASLQDTLEITLMSVAVKPSGQT